jgi:hypothetical protein
VDTWQIASSTSSDNPRERSQGMLSADDQRREMPSSYSSAALSAQRSVLCRK